MTASVTLNGVPVLADGPAAWEEISGSGFPLRLFRVHKSEWGRIEGGMGGEATLTISSNTAPTITIQRLVLVKEAPTGEPWSRGVLVSDLRFWWPYYLIHRDYNVVRKSGARRLVGDSVIELAQGVDSFTYAKWSLDPSTGKRWTARRFVEDVFGQLAERSGTSMSIDGIPVVGDESDGRATIQNVLLSENGTSAATRALAAIKGLDVAITREGTIRLFDATDYPAAAKMLDGKITTELGGQPRLVHMAGIRPAKVSVYFEREVEVRWDSREEDEDAPRYDAESIGADALDPIIDNVLPLPDPKTEIDGNTEGWAHGAWATVKQAVDAWAAQFPSFAGQGEVSLKSARANWWRLDAEWTLIGNAYPGAELVAWAARTSTFKNHYRRTYRIPRQWMENIREVRPYLVNVLDPITSTRGPAQAWGTYCVIPDQKYTLQRGGAPGSALATNVDGYPGIDGELTDDPASPCIVQVVDPHLGILSLDWQSDPYEMRRSIHPSMYVPLGSSSPDAPSRDFRDDRMSWDADTDETVPLVLTDDHRVAILTTCIPGSPNDKGRLLRVDVSPGQVAGRVGPGISVEGGQGPTFEVYVPAQALTAWYAWRETKPARSTARELFGLAPAGEDPREGYEVLNDGTGSVLQAFAEAMAISVWSSYADAIEGSPAYHLDPSMRPTGNIASVSHGVDPAGRQITQVGASGQRRPFDPMSFIPSPMRTLLVHRVPDGSV